jgi:hypothetical protein
MRATHFIDLSLPLAVPSLEHCLAEFFRPEEVRSLLRLSVPFFRVLRWSVPFFRVLR